MVLLTILTLIYAAVLVLTLAVSLIAVWIFLRRIRDPLREAAEALEQARDRTAGLQEPLEQWHKASIACAEELKRAEAELARACDRLATVARPAGEVLTR